jgi:hypothetical protein
VNLEGEDGNTLNGHISFYECLKTQTHAFSSLRMRMTSNIVAISQSNCKSGNIYRFPSIIGFSENRFADRVEFWVSNMHIIDLFETYGRYNKFPGN